MTTDLDMVQIRTVVAYHPMANVAAVFLATFGPGRFWVYKPDNSGGRPGVLDIDSNGQWSWRAEAPEESGTIAFPTTAARPALYREVHEIRDVFKENPVVRN